MGRVLKILFYAVLLVLIFLWIITVKKSCNNKSTDAELVEAIDDFDETSTDEFDLTEDVDDFSDEDEDSFDEFEDEALTEESYEDLDDAIESVDDLTAPIEETVEVVKETKTYTAPSNGSSYGRFLIVAGNYSIHANAESMRSKLKRMGYDGAEIVQFDNSSFSTVVASRFNDYEQALNEVSDLKARGIDCYVHKKK